MSYSHLKVFGCNVFAHIPKEQWTKLDGNLISCIFAEYKDEEFGCRLWDLIKKKVIKSIYVIFWESEVKINDDLSEKINNQNGVVPNLIIIPYTSNHSTSIDCKTNEVFKIGDQPDENIEEEKQLGDHTEEVEYPTEKEEHLDIWRDLKGKGRVIQVPFFRVCPCQWWGRA